MGGTIERPAARPLRLQLPPRGSLAVIDPQEEPTRYYYWPVVGWFYRKRLQMVLDLIGPGPYDAILEVAYGSGLFLPSLAKLCHQVHGIDLHTKVDLVRGELARMSVDAELRSGDALHMSYSDATFDCVVNVSMLEHLRDPGAAIDEMLRVLKPGGVLALGFPVRNPWMNAFFRLAGFRPEVIHPSSHRAILDAVQARCKTYRLAKLPEFAPLDLGLYNCCAITKTF